ncbi:putative hydrolase of the HAD superfamily [Pedobacter westerhofensis]|uniref:Putative hydrolase of the HAD superfamily n=1 Tax=Pedobacter westerhofensis TaxID=425512 RepID=A0A521FGG1_9SPHI|nr:HAD family hydrolase [Pedobacter westerhofensis]SMO95273.1 putative hydrolase of the HAD superfamily [Pedobacter westerhofensis]
MNRYKHYSFDLWLTLIKSNPDFKQERARIFHARYNPRNKSFAEVVTIFRNVDLMCNSINERTGKNIDADEMYLMVISILNDYHPGFAAVDTEALYMEMEELLFNYMPQIYCGNTAGILHTLKENASTVSLLSNTGFIRGGTLRKVLTALELDQYLDFQLYSDEVRLSKPNTEFFRLMLDQVNRGRQHNELELHEIVHVGDNPVADIHGASLLGIHSILINSNHQTITCLQ